MPISRRRLIFITAFLTVWAIVLVIRLIQIQLVRHDEYVTRAARQQERTVSLTPVRGSIRDRRGRLLAESVIAQSIYADPEAITDPKSVALALASVRELGLKPRELERRLSRGGEFAWIARQIDPGVAVRVKALKLEGIHSLEENRRSYPKGTLASNLVGYAGIDGEGLAGVEHSLDRWVRGRAGKVTVLRDARRGVYLVGARGANAPVDGNHVILTIDEVIQFIAERALGRAIRDSGATAGSAIVMDPISGAVLALASYPAFDPNRFRAYPPNTWRNRPVQDLYEPGSTFKIVTAAAGLEEAIVTPSQMIDCEMGSIVIANNRIREHGGNQYGFLSFSDVLAHSSNVGIIKVGLGLGSKRLYEYVRRFGFGERTGIELPGEASGLLRPTERWSALSNAVISLGQEIAVTPLQLLQSVSVVANGGRLVRPTVVERIIDGKGNAVFISPRPEPRRVISERTAAVLNEMLKGVVESGTGKNAGLEEFVVAGKTGTAQKASRGGYSESKFVASFAGYVPADRPRLAILVVVDEPRGVHYGGVIAAPAFREIAEGSLHYLGVAASIPGRTLSIPSTKLAVFSQAPIAGDGAVPSGRVPDFRGLDTRVAVSTATTAGYRVRVRGSGIVESQFPEPGMIWSRSKQIELAMAPAGVNQ